MAENATVKRVYNFSAGPAVLPLPVLEQAQRELLALPGCGASVMEISHRSKPFEAILEEAKNNLSQLLNLPDELPDPVSAGRCPSAVLHGPDEHRARDGQAGRFHLDRIVGQEGAG